MAPVHGQLRVGFQAFILCGPGVSLNTFTSHIEESPKALLPIANRPMVWYPMEWCHRMGIKGMVLFTHYQLQLHIVMDSRIDSPRDYSG